MVAGLGEALVRRSVEVTTLVLTWTLARIGESDNSHRGWPMIPELTAVPLLE